MKRIQKSTPLWLIMSVGLYADVRTEYFGMGKYVNDERQWSYRTYDGTVEATFDDAGNNLGANRYSAFGSRISKVGEENDREAFQGQDFRKDVDHYNLGVRNMSPDNGRWLQPEPMVIMGIPTNRLSAPLHLNPYRYAGNNTMIWTDPNGLWTVPTVCREESPFAVGLRNAMAGGLDMIAATIKYAGDESGVSDFADGFSTPYTIAASILRVDPEPRRVCHQPDVAGAALVLALPMKLPEGLMARVVEGSTPMQRRALFDFAEESAREAPRSGAAMHGKSSYFLSDTVRANYKWSYLVTDEGVLFSVRLPVPLTEERLRILIGDELVGALREEGTLLVENGAGGETIQIAITAVK